jgi:hypothetical protein
VADAINRELAVRSGGADGDDAGGDGALDALRLLDALHAQLGESRDVILAWPWKRFCAEWARLYPASARERERQEAQRQQEEFAKLEREGRGWG